MQTIQNRTATAPELISRRQSVKPTTCAAMIAAPGSTILLRDLESGCLRSCTIVDPMLAQAVTGAISILSPLGSALTGCLVGDKVDCWELWRCRPLVVEKITAQ